MSVFGNKISLLLAGITLLAVGLVAPLISEAGWISAAASLALISGFMLLCLGSDAVKSSSRPWSREKKVEYGIYGVAAAMFLIVLASAAVGYFSDFLTYSFAVAFLAAASFRLWRILTP